MLVSSQNLVLIRACMLWTAGYYLISDPQRVFKNPIVVVLGAGVDIKQTYTYETGVLVPLVGALLAIGGTQDIALQSTQTLQSVVQLRLVAIFALCVASYLGKFGMGYSVVFAYAFGDLVLNFMIFLTVREENNEASKLQIRRDRGMSE